MLAGRYLEPLKRRPVRSTVRNMTVVGRVRGRRRDPRIGGARRSWLVHATGRGVVGSGHRPRSVEERQSHRHGALDGFGLIAVGVRRTTVGARVAPIAVCMSPRLRASCFVAFTVAAGCCEPHIRSFEVTPQIVCEDQPAVARWSADGEVAMTMAIESPPLGPDACAATGEQTVRLTMVARRHDVEKTAPVEVVRVGRGASEPVVLRTTTIAGNDVVAEGDKAPALWDARVKIVTIASCEGRAIRATHAGKMVSLRADGTASADLDGAPIGGAWEFRTPMSQAERTNPALRPKTLSVLAAIRCKSEAP
jgi:hypothetical protein